MKKFLLAAFVVAAIPLAASAATWKNVSMVDVACSTKVKADPDKHPTSCAIKCSQSGYGIITADGKYLKFDSAGNQKALAALKATKKADHVRVSVDGDLKGDTITVKSLSLD